MPSGSTSGYGRCVKSLWGAPSRAKVAPSVVEVGCDAFSSTQVGDALLASQPFENDADILFRRELPSGSTTDVTYCCFGGLLVLLGHETLLGVLRTPSDVS